MTVGIISELYYIWLLVVVIDKENRNDSIYLGPKVTKVK